MNRILRYSRRAFTLIEMVVVIGVLMALAALIIPTYQLILAQLELSTAVGNVSDYIRQSAQNTVGQQKIYGVTLVPGSNNVAQFLYEPADGSKVPVGTMELPSYIQISEVNFGGATDIRFTTSGSPSVSGNLVLTDLNRSRSRRIELRPSGAIFDNTPEY